MPIRSRPTHAPLRSDTFAGGGGLTDDEVLRTFLAELEERLNDTVEAVEQGGGGGGGASAAEDVTFTPAAGIAATDVQAALQEVAGDVGTVAADVTQLQIDVGAVETDVGQLQTDVAAKLSSPAGAVDGDMLIYDGSAWIRAVEPTGFGSTSLASIYQAGGPGYMPGADDFIVLVNFVPFANYDTAKVHIIAENRNGATGWRISVAYGALIFQAFDGTGASCESSPGASDYVATRAKGMMHALGLRARQVGGVLSVEGWLGPCRISAPDTGAAGMAAASAGTLQLGGGTAFGDEVALNGAVFGVAYKAGTLTDDEMRAVMGRMLRSHDVPTAGMDRVYRGRDLAQGTPAGATWAPAVGAGNLVRVGTPPGVRGYFPPV
jgi:hypothetical protein